MREFIDSLPLNHDAPPLILHLSKRKQTGGVDREMIVG